MTNTSTEQPEALRLADLLTNGYTPSDGLLITAAAELRRLHARVQELEAELEKAKASVSGLKKRSDDWKWRALNAEAAQERAPLSESEVYDLWEGATGGHSFTEETLRTFVRAIERAHGITQEKQG